MIWGYKMDDLGVPVVLETPTFDGDWLVYWLMDWSIAWFIGWLHAWMNEEIKDGSGGSQHQRKEEVFELY